MRGYLSLLFVLGLIGTLAAQRTRLTAAYPSSGSFSFGVAYFGLTDEVGGGVHHRERTYLTNVGYKISSRWSTLIQANIIRSNVEPEPHVQTTALLFTGSVQHDFVPDSPHRLFAQLGVATGDFCTCGDRLPRIDPGLVYVQYGAGINVRIWRQVYIDIAFEANTILSGPEDAYNYNVGTVGLHFENLFSVRR
ncbi:hypothetical protein CLV84_2144 [Neolewinella xylanilytica]|uniref:Outer membrane protein with beta-barrel domain n=1 Tax=Neolewinella xylanilytica TaxID=1514080 RepID=A0A2S6I245_9BACT|nr:hypothetical protein CLV84_2144 [Neolewinella xylanilytica]